MEIKIRKDILLEALQLIVNISPKSTTEPVINNVLIETSGENGNQSVLKATNYDNSFQGYFDSEIVQDGKLCLNTAKLYNLVREFSEEWVEIKSTPQNWIFINNGRTQIMLPGVEPDLFPVIEFTELENRLVMDGSLLKTSIDRTFFAIGENESRRNLMGLNLAIMDQNRIHWQGADAFRISQNITEVENASGASGNIIIPKKSLVEIRKILEHHTGEIVISFNDNTFQIHAGSIYFKTRLIEASFPNLENIVEKVGNNCATLPRKELINALKIQYRVSDEDPNSVVKLSFNDDKVLIESQKMEFGEGNDQIPCTYQGEEISVGVNIRFLLDSLQVFEGSSEKSVRLMIQDPLSPIMLQNEDWKQFKTILMPVKIKW